MLGWHLFDGYILVAIFGSAPFLLTIGLAILYKSGIFFITYRLGMWTVIIFVIGLAQGEVGGTFRGGGRRY